MAGLRKFFGIVWALGKTTVYIAFAAVCAVGLLHAFTARSPADDRQAELSRKREQLLEAETRHQELKARAEAFATRADVRIQTIRTELGMLRPGERIYVLK